MLHNFAQLPEIAKCQHGLEELNLSIADPLSSTSWLLLQSLAAQQIPDQV